MLQLADALAPFAGRVVVDRTGLSVSFDIDLEWVPETRVAAELPTPQTPTGDIPGLFTALKEQLGLKLDEARGPVEIVVIDSVSALAPN